MFDMLDNVFGDTIMRKIIEISEIINEHYDLVENIRDENYYQIGQELFDNVDYEEDKLTRCNLLDYYEERFM